MKKNKKKKNKKKEFWTIIVAAVLLMFILVFYIITNTSKITSCASESGCSVYEVTGFFKKYVCAQKNLQDNFYTKFILFKHTLNTGIKQRPENCFCDKGVCSLP